MYKILAIDIDDTLLNSEKAASEANICAIHKAQEMGVKVVLCSGRPCNGIMDFWEEWGINAPIIGSGGAEVYDPKTKKMLLHEPLSTDEAREILNWANEKGVHAQVYKDNYFIFAKHSELTEFYGSCTRLQPLADPDFLQNMDYPTNKVLLISNPESIDGLYDEACERFKHKYFLTTSGTAFLEFMKITATKGIALRRLAEHFGFTSDEVVAVGDQRIDVAMLEYAGLGIAVGNAVEECKAVADYIAPDCDHDAVAHVVNKFIIQNDY